MLGHPSPRGQTCPYFQQEVPQGHKGGSVLWFVSPALYHDIIDVLGAVFGPGQTLPFLVNLMQDLEGECNLKTSRAPRSSFPTLSPAHGTTGALGCHACTPKKRSSEGRAYPQASDSIPGSGPPDRGLWQRLGMGASPTHPSPDHYRPFSLLSAMRGHTDTEPRGQDCSKQKPVLTGPGWEPGIKATPIHPVRSTSPTPHLTAIKANPGLLAIGEHLPQCYPKHPGVTGMGEGACLQALRGTPGRGRGQTEGLSEHPYPHRPQRTQMLIQQAHCCPRCQAQQQQD